MGVCRYRSVDLGYPVSAIIQRYDLILDALECILQRLRLERFKQFIHPSSLNT